MTALLAMSIWWAARLGSAGLLSFEAGITLGVMLHFALVISVSFIAVYQHIEPPHFIDRFKSGLRPAILYAVLASGSIVAYHHVVMANATHLRQLEFERFIEASLSDEEAYAKLQAEDARLATLDREAAKEQALDSMRFQFDPLWHFTAALLMWIAVALMTSLFTSGLAQWLRAWPS